MKVAPLLAAVAALGVVVVGLVVSNAPAVNSMPVDPKEKSKILKDLRTQLSRLGYSGCRRAPSHAAPAGGDFSPQHEPLVYHRDLPRSESTNTVAPRLGNRHRVALEDSVTNGSVVVTARGPVFEVLKPISHIAGAEAVSSAFSNNLFDAASPLCVRLSVACDPGDVSVQDVVFMDIETTGLTNSPLFLIGVMVWEGSGFVVRQFFARNYAEEAATILRFVEECTPRKLLVTFNGKSFDYPYIRARAAATGVPFDLEMAHLDLLHVGRRIWKTTLPNCKLQTIEKYVCGRVRHGDIPGSEIPDAYHAYVRSDDAWQMVEALKHNMLDLVTLADMMNRFPPVE